MNEEERKKQLKQMEAMGVDVTRLPEITDEASLFDYTYKVLLALSNSVGADEPTYDMVTEAVNTVRREFDF